MTSAVFVVVVVLATGIVDVHHGERQSVCAFALVQPHDAGGGLFASADDRELSVGRKSAVDFEQIAAVINDEIRLVFENHAKMILVGIGINAMNGINFDTEASKASRNVILSGQGIAAGGINLGASGLQNSS